MANSIDSQTLTSCNEYIQKNNLKKGFLFSALAFDKTPIGIKWNQLRIEAVTKFPNLKIKKTPDLHITIIYIGEWDVKNYNEYQRLALIAPSENQELHLEPVQMGRNKQVIALELHGISNDWSKQIVQSKETLNSSNLKKADVYDSNFRAHITLAESINKVPTEQEFKELDEFKTWISQKLSPSDLVVTIDSNNKPVLLLAGTSRSKTSPADYVEAFEFLNSLGKK